MQWAVNSSHILAVALVGSYARGTAHPDSDIDIMVITSNPELFRQGTQWISEIGWDQLEISVIDWKDAEYELVWSRHMLLSNGLQVEFSFGPSQWAAIDPIDPGTKQVILDGCWILLDPTGLLNQLLHMQIKNDLLEEQISGFCLRPLDDL